MASPGKGLYVCDSADAQKKAASKPAKSANLIVIVCSSCFRSIAAYAAFESRRPRQVPPAGVDFTDFPAYFTIPDR